MKPQVAPYETSVKCLRIVCRNGLTVRVTRYPVDLVMSNGQVYVSGSGYDFTSYEATAGFSPSAFDLEGILGFAGVTRDAVASGVFDGARAYLFACDYRNPVEDYEPIVASFLGKGTLTDSGYRFEEMALIDALNQSVGDTYKPQCGKVFGGQEYAGCKVSLAALTVTGTLTSVTSSSAFADAGRSESSDWFALGTICFTSGLNAGLKPLEIKSFAAGGGIVTYEPFYYTPVIGDAYEMIPGCRKRLSDCRDKYANVVNFGGFPDMPTSSVYAQVGTR
nr:DUF2163 domain-containing protein [Dechloromonas sp.]